MFASVMPSWWDHRPARPTIRCTTTTPPRSSVPNNSDAGGGVISTGRSMHPISGSAAPYSSRGPTNDLRTKPDLTGVDGVQITGAGGFPSPLTGRRPRSACRRHRRASSALQADLKAAEPGTTRRLTAAPWDALLNSVRLIVRRRALRTSMVWGRADALNAADEICPTPFGPPTHGNLMVTSSLGTETHLMFEYTNAGSLVQKARAHLARLGMIRAQTCSICETISLQPDGKIAIYDGNNFRLLPTLSTTYNPVDRTWTHHTAQDWSVSRGTVVRRHSGVPELRFS